MGVPMDIIKRNTFPKLPWGFIENPKTLKGEDGKELFVDGWWKYGRKIHYTADLTMAFLWGLSGAKLAFIPFYYFTFFLSFLTHRAKRDEDKCAKKYGALWDKYLKLVPYRFIPYVV
jgi:delta24(24(1))-sterol reductase